MDKNLLLREIDTLPIDCIAEVFDFVGHIKSRRLKNTPDTMKLSEQALARDWNSPEEDAAWSGL